MALPVHRNYYDQRKMAWPSEDISSQNLGKVTKVESINLCFPN